MIDVRGVRLIFEMTPLGVSHWFVVIPSLSVCVTRVVLGWVCGFLPGGVFTFVKWGSGGVVVCIWRCFFIVFICIDMVVVTSACV
jgi:hypothetical protein